MRILRTLRVRLTLALTLEVLVAIAFCQYWKQRELRALALNVYREAILANEPEIGSQMVAYVTTQRAALNKKEFGGDTIYGVVYARHQFSWTGTAIAKKKPVMGPKLQQAINIAQDEIDGDFTPPPNLIGATFYLNPAYSERHNICEFKITLVYLGKADPESRHEFYREPKNAAERDALPKKENVEECKPPAPEKVVEKRT